MGGRLHWRISTRDFREMSGTEDVEVRGDLTRVAYSLDRSGASLASTRQLLAASQQIHLGLATVSRALARDRQQFQWELAALRGRIAEARDLRLEEAPPTRGPPAVKKSQRMLCVAALAASLALHFLGGSAGRPSPVHLDPAATPSRVPLLVQLVDAPELPPSSVTRPIPPGIRSSPTDRRSSVPRQWRSKRHPTTRCCSCGRPRASRPRKTSRHWPSVTARSWPRISCEHRLSPGWRAPVTRDPVTLNVTPLPAPTTLHPALDWIPSRTPRWWRGLTRSWHRDTRRPLKRRKATWLQRPTETLPTPRLSGRAKRARGTHSQWRRTAERGAPQRGPNRTEGPASGGCHWPGLLLGLPATRCPITASASDCGAAPGW